MSSCFEIEPYHKKPFVDELRNFSDWENSESKYYRKDLLSYIYQINKGLCYYCKTYIPYGSCVAHIEHIVNKDRHPEFSYRPENLTLCCPICNSYKGVNEVLSKDKADIERFEYDEYPLDKNDFLIVHSYLDKYEDEITFIDGWEVKAVNESKKGKETIRICFLTRSNLAILKMQQLKIKQASCGYSRAIAMQIGDDKEQLNKIDKLLGDDNYDNNEEFFFIPVIIQEFARELKLDTSKKREIAKETIKSLDENKVKVYKVVINYLKLSSISKSGLNDLVKEKINDSIEFKKVIKIIIEILDMQKNILDNKKYREMIRFLVYDDVNYNEICDYLFGLFGIKIFNDEERLFIYKLKYLVDICKILEANNIYDDIKKYNDILSEFMKELNVEREKQA